MCDEIVTVIIPTYNLCDFIADSIEGILNQTYKNIELIIVNDGSTDNTEYIIKQYIEIGEKYNSRVKYLYQENQGKVAAINNALNKSIGKFITILDGDDLFPKDSIMQRVKILEKYPNVMSVYGNASLIDVNGNVYGIQKARVVNNKMELINFVKNPIASSSIMFRRIIIEKIGQFDSYIKRLDDVDRNINLFLCGDMFYIPKILLLHRTYKRKGNIKTRLISIYEFHIIANKYFHTPMKQIIVIKQVFYQCLKLVYQLFTWRR